MFKPTSSCFNISNDTPKLSSPMTSVAMKVNHFKISALLAKASRFILEMAISTFALIWGSNRERDELEKFCANKRRRIACCFWSINENIPGWALSLKVVYQSLFLKLDPTQWICLTLDKSAMAISLGEIRTYGPCKKHVSVTLDCLNPFYICGGCETNHELYAVSGYIVTYSQPEYDISKPNSSKRRRKGLGLPVAELIGHSWWAFELSAFLQLHTFVATH